MGTCIHWSIKYCPVRVLFFNRKIQIADHYLKLLYLNRISIFNSHGESHISLFNRNGLVIDQSHSSIFNRNGLVTDQSLTAMARRSEFNSNCKLRIVILARDWLIKSYFYRLAGS